MVALVDVDPGDETPRSPTEEERTSAYLEQQLVLAGFNPFQAAAIVDAKADWHVAVRLVADGCDHETVVDILT